MTDIEDTETKYVLFSPLGMTDPISNYHDGAMLHIARVYRPSRIYLYMSKEVLALSDKDDRYCRAIKQLGEQIGQPFSFDVIKRPELSNVHLFDEFYDDFEKELRRIKEENPDAVILLNVSSGTPAMKSALHTIAAMSDDHIPVQVSTPERRHNPRRDDVASYDFDAEWDCNCDNGTAPTVRTSVSKNHNLVLKLRKEIICKHIDAFDYHAALAVAEGSTGMPEDALRLLRAACARVQLDRAGVDKEIKEKDERNIFAPVSSSDLRAIAESLMLLDIELKKHEYRSFILGFSPVFLDLLELLLEKDGQNIHSYCDGRILRVKKLESSEHGKKILDILDNYFNNYYCDSMLSSAQLVPLVCELTKLDNNTKEAVSNLRTCESECRNLAAHEIVSVTEKTITDKCKIAPGRILDYLVSLAAHIDIPKEKLDRSYEKLNEFIKEALGKGV